MRRLPTGRTGQVLAVLLLLLVLALAWTAVAAPLLAWHADRADALDRRAALARRMVEIAATLPQYEAAARTEPSGPAPIAVFDGASDAIAGAALQQKVQDLAGQSRTSLTSTESLPAEQLGAYRRIAVRIAVNAPWPNLIALLDALAGTAPAMVIDDLEVRGSRGFIRDGAAPLDASLVVIGFRAGAAGP